MPRLKAPVINNNTLIYNNSLIKFALNKLTINYGIQIKISQNMF